MPPPPERLFPTSRGVTTELWHEGQMYFLCLPTEDNSKVNITFPTADIGKGPTAIVPLSQCKYGTISGAVERGKNPMQELIHEAKQEYKLELIPNQISVLEHVAPTYVLQLKGKNKYIRGHFLLTRYRIELTLEQLNVLQETGVACVRENVDAAQVRPELRYLFSEEKI